MTGSAPCSAAAATPSGSRCRSASCTACPANWDFTYGAALPEVFYTAFVNLFLEAGLQPGETALIHGGASGVGTAAIQLARQSGCRVLATAGSERKLECCRRLGAELAVDYKREDFAAAVLAHCGGADVVLDIAGASSLAGQRRGPQAQGQAGGHLRSRGNRGSPSTSGPCCASGCASPARCCAAVRSPKRRRSRRSSRSACGG